MNRTWKVVSYKIDLLDGVGWNVTCFWLNIVADDLSRPRFIYDASAKKPWKPCTDKRPTKAEREFMQSALAASVVAEATAMTQKKISVRAKDIFTQAAADALCKGSTCDELKNLVDDVFVSSVMTT